MPQFPEAQFLISAWQPKQFPPDEGREVAFVGRSNAGKSTAVNTLAQQKRLAFASKTPGRTQHINLFALGPKDEPELEPGFVAARIGHHVEDYPQEQMKIAAE